MKVNFGYMPGFEDITDEISFAKRHFDFFELTYPPVTKITESTFSEYGSEWIEAVKGDLGDFPVLGHLAWFNFSTNNEAVLKQAIKAVKLMINVGVSKLTVHPSGNEELADSQVIANNILALKVIKETCATFGVQMLLENNPGAPFNDPRVISALINSLEGVALTLDIGHCYVNSDDSLNAFLDTFRDQTSHIHLHDAIDNMDHIPFSNTNKIQEFMDKLKEINYQSTLTLEIFKEVKDGNLIDIPYKEKQKVILDQLRIVQSYL